MEGLAQVFLAFFSPNSDTTTIQVPGLTHGRAGQRRTRPHSSGAQTGKHIMIKASGLKILTVAVVALSLAGCESMGGQKQTGGTILGGIGGAAIGSQFGKGTGQIVGVAAGTLLGALVGSEVGKSL